MSWRKQMEEARKLRAEGSKMVYQRMVILMAIESDPEFVDWCAQTETNIYDVLDEEVAELNANYLVLVAVMKKYPKELDWAKKLGVLIAEVKESQKRTRESGERTSWKEIAEERQKEIERLTSQLASAMSRITELERILELAITGKITERELESVG